MKPLRAKLDSLSKRLEELNWLLGRGRHARHGAFKKLRRTLGPDRQMELYGCYQKASDAAEARDMASDAP